MQVFYKRGRRYDLCNNQDQIFTVFARKDGSIINHTTGSEKEEKAITAAIKSYNK